MATALDVAAYILEKRGPMTAMKLQKLVYYSQAWSLVWDEKTLFTERIEAWAMGPVVPNLYHEHCGMYYVPKLRSGDSSVLTVQERETVDAVLDFYGGKTSKWLSDLSHQEDPWKKARHGISDGEFCDREITHAAMDEYYLSLPPAN